MEAAVIRPIKKVVRGCKSVEGPAHICRTLGSPQLRNLDPFLMLDEFKIVASEADDGFPDHPHRGFETCTIVLEGNFKHRDSMGNEGVIGPGGAQWLTAGRGLVHSEMPAVKTGVLRGFQLWINLPAKDKMCKPRYQDLQADGIPVAEKDGASVRVLAGESLGVKGPFKLRHPELVLDVRLSPGAQFQQRVPESWNGMAYVYDGSGQISDQAATVEHAFVLDDTGNTVQATAGDEGLKFLLICGKPIGEPIVQYGPFVMTTEEEIQQAFRDYEAGRLQRRADNPWKDDNEDGQH